jgi:DNA-binding NarL/FixJ family response regulator
VRSKIIFLSIHEDVDFVTAGFDIGACGYVFKSRVADDLRKAIEIVYAGGRFVSPTSLRSVTHFLLTIALGLIHPSSVSMTPPRLWDSDLIASTAY